MSLSTKKLIGIIAFAFLSFFSSAEEVSTYPSCGLENGKLDPFSTVICPDSSYLHVLVSAFPYQMEHWILPSVVEYPVSFITNSSKYNPSSNFENTFSVIMTFFIHLVMILGVIGTIRTFVVYYLHLVADGEADKKYMGGLGHSFQYMIGIMLIVKVGKFPLIANLLLYFAAQTAAIATSIYSTYLSYLQDDNIQIIDITEEVDQIDRIKTDNYNHNKSIAYDYVSALTKINLCKQQNTLFENRIAQHKVNSFNKSSIIDNLYLENGQKLIKSNETEGIFLNIDDKLVSQNIRIRKGIVFGKPTEEKKTQNLFDFECGSISANISSIKDTSLDSVAQAINFYQRIDTTVSQIQHYSENGIQSLVQSSSNEMQQAIASHYGLKDLKKLNKSHVEIIKKFTLIFHQHVLAAAMIGYSVNKNGKIVKDYSHLFNKSMKTAEAIATGVREQSCFSNGVIVQGSVKAFKTFADNNERPNSNVVCLNVSEKGIIGVLASDSNKKRYNLNQVETARVKAETALETLKSGLITDIAAVRTAIERSYSLEVNKIDNSNSYLIKLRQEGLFRIPTDFLKLQNSLHLNKLSKSQLSTSIRANTNSLNGTFITVDGDAEISSTFVKIDDKFNKLFNGQGRRDSDIEKIDFSTYTENYISESASRNTAGTSFTKNVLEFVASPMKNYISTYELDSHNCPEKLFCYARNDSPIIRQVEFGNSLLTVSATIIMLKSISGLAFSGLNKSKGKLKKGNFSKSKKYSAVAFSLVFSIVGGAIESVMPIVYMFVAAGSVLTLLPMIFVIILSFSFIGYLFHLFFYMNSIVFMTLRFFRVNTIDDVKNLFKSLLNFVFFMLMYMPMLVLSLFISIELINTVSTLISIIISNQYSEELNSEISLFNLIKMAIIFTITALVNFMVTVNLIRKVNDLINMVFTKSLFNFERNEQDVTDMVKHFGAGMITFAPDMARKKSAEKKNKQRKKQEKLRLERELEKEQEEKENKNEGDK